MRFTMSIAFSHPYRFSSYIPPIATYLSPGTPEVVGAGKALGFGSGALVHQSKEIKRITGTEEALLPAPEAKC